MGKLDQRVAIVTGGGTGVGKGIALEFAKSGADVVVASRTLANLEKVAQEIRALGRHSLAVVTDVSVAEQVRSMVQQTLDEFGRIDILVNNAATTRHSRLIEMSEEAWDTVLSVNLKGVFLCTQAVGEYMIKQKYGKIINVSSVAGLGNELPKLANYASSKAGVNLLTKVTAWELGPYGINANAIALGAIETDLIYVSRTLDEAKQVRERYKSLSVLGRLGTIQDSANLALFLASDDSSFITGQVIVADGGLTNRM